MNDGELLASWLNQLARPYPDIQLVASLEAQALQRGWHPQRALQALTAADFQPDLHPRGRDGKFIEKFGLIELFGKFRTSTGKEIDATGKRGRVESIQPDPNTPGRPNIRVNMLGKDGKPVGGLTVKPDQIVQAPEKARLDAPLTAQDANRKPTGAKSLNLSQQTDLKGPLEPRKPTAPMAPRPAKERPPETPQQRERRLAMDQAKAATDAELARQAALPEGDTPQVWKDAIKAEQENRAKHRAAQQKPRQKLIDDINAQAATLSTTDAEERAAGLDKILAKLRFSIIDTDKLYGNDYPPGGSGRWTKERHDQHEAMYAEVLANVKAAGIPQDRDAFILGGLPGAGKSYSLRPGGKAESFGVHAWEMTDPVPAAGTATHVSINPDTVKEMMVDRGMTPPGIEGLKPMEQVTFIHSESAYLAKMFQNRLSDDGYNVVIDRTFESSGGMQPVLGALADDGYTFRGLFVDIPIDESRESTRRRYLQDALTDKGGRFVPSSVQGNRASSQGNLSKNRDAFNSYAEDDWFDEWMIIDNSGITDGNPKGDVVDHGTSDGDGTAAYRPAPTPGSPAHRRAEVQAMTDDELIEAVDPDDPEIMREYNARFPPPPKAERAKTELRPVSDAVEATNPGVRLDLTNPAPGLWRVGGIRVDPKQRGKGAAGKAMQDLIAQADREGATLSLTPEQFGGQGGLSTAQLRDWYAKLGFVPNTGPGRLLETTDTMIRPPAGAPAPAAPVASP